MDKKGLKIAEIFYGLSQACNKIMTWHLENFLTFSVHRKVPRSKRSNENGSKAFKWYNAHHISFSLACGRSFSRNCCHWRSYDHRQPSRRIFKVRPHVWLTPFFPFFLGYVCWPSRQPKRVEFQFVEVTAGRHRSFQESKSIRTATGNFEFFFSFYKMKERKGKLNNKSSFM